METNRKRCFIKKNDKKKGFFIKIRLIKKCQKIFFSIFNSKNKKICKKLIFFMHNIIKKKWKTILVK